MRHVLLLLLALVAVAAAMGGPARAPTLEEFRDNFTPVEKMMQVATADGNCTATPPPSFFCPAGFSMSGGAASGAWKDNYACIWRAKPFPEGAQALSPLFGLASGSIGFYYPLNNTDYECPEGSKPFQSGLSLNPGSNPYYNMCIWTGFRTDYPGQSNLWMYSYFFPNYIGYGFHYIRQ